MWTDVPAQDQPAAFLAYSGENVVPRRGLPSEHQIEFKIYLYVRTDEPGAIPQQLLNVILDSIDAAFSPDAGQAALTLGVSGVSRIWVEGEIVTCEGTLGEQAAAIIPLKVLAM